MKVRPGFAVVLYRLLWNLGWKEVTDFCGLLGFSLCSWGGDYF